MHFTKKSALEKRSDFVKKLQSKKLLRFPGAYNPLCAKLISEIGFDGVYISGGVMSNDLGLPDIGLTTLDHVSYRANQISRVTDLPTIVDADTGFGDCKKTISTFENKGLYAPGNLNNFLVCNFFTKSDLFSNALFFVKCIAPDLY